MAIAAACLWTADFATTLAFTMIRAAGGLDGPRHRAIPYLLCAAACVVLALLAWLCVPERKGKELEE